MKKVFQFTRYDVGSDQEVLSRRRATSDAIERVNGRAIEGTETEVDEAEVDADGFARAMTDEVPFGWEQNGDHFIVPAVAGVMRAGDPLQRYVVVEPLGPDIVEEANTLVMGTSDLSLTTEPPIITISAPAGRIAAQIVLVDLRTLNNWELIDLVRLALREAGQRIQSSNSIDQPQKDELKSLLKASLAYLDPDTPKADGWLLDFLIRRIEALAEAGLITLMHEHHDVLQKFLEILSFFLAN